MPQPTAREQQMLELINRMRQAPSAELNLLINSGDSDVASALSFFNVNTSILAQQRASLSPTSPVAWSNQLSDAAIGHNQQMIAANVQSHQVTALNELTLGQRATNSAYTGWNALGENIFAYSKSVFYGHAGFAIDWGNEPGGIQLASGHRTNMMNPIYREVGIGITPSIGDGSGTVTGPLVITEDFGSRFALSGKAWLLGVAFRDFDRDQFYDPGEGLSGITVQVTKTGFTAPILTTTLDAGGYQTLLDPGQYQLSFIQNGVALKSETILIDAQNPVNLKRDLILNPVGVENDFNGDGKADILWRNTNGQVALWQMNGSMIQNASVIGGSTNDWVIQDSGDFNGDGKADILWRNTNGQVALWQMNGSTIQNVSVVGNSTNDWVIQDSGDFNGDGKADILWRNTSGQVALWQMNGSTIQNVSVVGNSTNDWIINGVNDFNGDGKDGILWRNTDGRMATWQMSGGTIARTSIVGTTANEWSVNGTGDYNGDGTADILWRNTSGAAAIWQVNSGALTEASLISQRGDNNWQVVAS
jgi:FG-GAP-like repeat/Cysteine-rich secretory protein family